MINKVQRKSIAKFMYDMCKIVLTVAVISNIYSKEVLQIEILVTGIVGAVIFFWGAYYLERKVENESK